MICRHIIFSSSENLIQEFAEATNLLYEAAETHRVTLIGLEA